MRPERTCPDCGSTLPPDGPRGLCPRCLMGAALSRQSAGGAAETGVFEPASIGVLATISQTIGPVPRVLLRDTAPGEAPGPIVRPDGNGSDPSTRYRIDGEIARGGMGSVLKGRDPDLGREVAVKVLREDYRDDPAMIRRFVEEAQIGGQLQHPGVVPIYELGTFADCRPFFAMKLVKGHTLAQLLDQRPDPSSELPRHLSIFESICQTVAYAHARGVIHRDLKPSNVMVGSFGEVQVMDWGLAKVLPRGGIADDATAGKMRDETVIATARSGSDDPELSHAGSVMGTPSYMAPEQARGEVDQIDERADVFALGSILCEVLTGKPAFIGRKSGEIQRKAALGDTVDALARLDASGADADLITLAKHCLARERDDRPRDANLISKQITAYLASVQARMRKAELTSVEERGRRRLTTVVAAGLLALTTASGLGFTYFLQQRQASEARVALALKEASLLRDQAIENPEDPARWPAALDGLKRAEKAVAEAGDPEARHQLALLGPQIQAGAEAAENDKSFLARLMDIRSATADDLEGSITDAAYATAFREAGYDIDGLDANQVATRIKARPEPVRRGMVATLDHWIGVRKERGVNGAAWPRLVAVARLADPDPDRDALRAALAVADRANLLAQLRPLSERADAGTWSPASLVLLANTLDSAGDVASGVRVLRRASGVHPSDAWVHYTLGRLLNKSTRYQEGIEAFAAARALRPELGHELAHSLEKQNRGEEAEAVFRDLVSRRPNNTRHLGCLGNHLQEKGRAAEATPYLDRVIAEYRKAIELDPKSASAHINLGNALKVEARFDEASAEYRQAIELDPRSASAHYSLGNALDSKGQVDQAITEFRKAIELDPRSVMAHNNLGLALAKKGQFDEAIAEFRRAVEFDPRSAPVHYNLGRELFKKGQFDEAIAEFRKSIEFDPNSALAHASLGNVLNMKGRFDEAISVCRKAIELDPNSPVAHCNLGTALRGRGSFVEALAARRRGHELGLKQPGWRYPSAEWVRESESLVALDGKLTAFLRGEFQPRDNTERFGLASICQIKKLNHAAARLYNDAFAAEPKLADDLKAGHRYNAACHAALTAAGQGEESAKLDEPERTRLRKQALDWLRADLALWTKQSESSQPAARAEVGLRMTHWRQDSDLAYVRNLDELAKVSEAERQEWEALWKDVEALLKKAEGRTP